MPAKRFLLITLLLACSFVRAQQPNSASVPMFDVGTLSENTYANECLGISFHIPEGWQINYAGRSAPEKALRVPNGGLGLLVIEHPVPNLPVSRIVLAANPAHDATTTAQDWVTSAVQSQINTDSSTHQLLRETAAVEFAGKPFFRSDFKQSFSDGRSLYVAYAYTRFREYFIGESVMSGSAEETDRAVNSLQSLTFQTDQPNPSCVLGPDPAPSETALPERVRISQGVSQGLLIRKVQPRYPEQARRNWIQGTVLLKALIDAEGNVEQLDLVSGHPALAPAAIDAVKQWKYKPYLLNGKAVKVETQITVIFSLQAH